MTPAPSLDRLFEFEDHLEQGFVALLTENNIATPFSSRSPLTQNSPYTSLFCTIGQSLQHNFNCAGVQFWDWYEASLTTESVTNRITDEVTLPMNHVRKLGKLRTSLQLPILRLKWDATNYLNIVDIRASQTIDTWQDEDALDHTQIVWNLTFNINAWAWPENPFEIPAETD